MTTSTVSLSSSGSKTIDTPIGKLHVEVRGAGPVVLIWPSLYCDSPTVEPIAAELAPHYRVVVVDGPGHGRSGPSPAPFSLDDCADAAMVVLDGLGAGRAIWIGAAWGGHVGIAAARRHRERIAGLVILNTPMASWRGGRLALMRLTYALLWLFGPRSFVAAMVADKMIASNAGPDRQALVDQVAAALGRCHPAGLLTASRSAMFARGDLVPVLPEIRVPTIFFTGAQDSLFPVDEARFQAGKIPQCLFVVVEGSSHQSAIEAPQQVLPIIRREIASWV